MRSLIRWVFLGCLLYVSLGGNKGLGIARCWELGMILFRYLYLIVGHSILRFVDGRQSSRGVFLCMWLRRRVASCLQQCIGPLTV